MNQSDGLTQPNIKVLHLIDSGGLYGAEKMLLSLCAEQIKQGLQPLILSVGTTEQGEKPLEVEAKSLGLPIKAWRMKPGFNFWGMLTIVKFAKHHGFNFFHSHGYKFNVLLGLIPKGLRGAPVVSTIHGYVLPPRFSKMRAYLFLDRIFLPRLDKVVFVNSLMLEQPFFKSLKLENSSVIENGINLETSFNVTTLSVGDVKAQSLVHAGPVIGYIGRLSQEKGVSYLIEAFHNLSSDVPDAFLLICGDGPLKSELEEEVGRLGLSEKVLFSGFVGDVKSALNKMDVFVMPSLTEGMPIVLLEAMALGKSIVATSVGGMPAMLDQGLAGMLIAPKDIEGIVTSLRSLLVANVRSSKLEYAAQEKFLSCYSGVKMAESYLALYRG